MKKIDKKRINQKIKENYIKIKIFKQIKIKK